MVLVGGEGLKRIRFHKYKYICDKDACITIIDKLRSVNLIRCRCPLTSSKIALFWLNSSLGNRS